MSEGANREELNPYARLTPTHRLPKDILWNAKCKGFIEHHFYVRGWKGLLRDTGLSAFNFRERWKYEIKIGELWMVCLSWCVNFESFIRDIRDFHLIFFVKIEPQLKTNFTVKPVDLQMNFFKGLKRPKGRIIKRSLASVEQNRVLSHFNFFQRF